MSNDTTSSNATPLYLRRGELVEVLSEAEILATLGNRGELDGLPFMPEMLASCGKQFRVYRRADKTCDTISGNITGRRMRDAVHLEDVRCNGVDHGGCQAACLIFWKEAWLKRVEPPDTGALWRRIAKRGSKGTGELPDIPCTREEVEHAAIASDESESDELRYRCQVTQLLDATEPIAWNEWDQYLRDWLSGNVSLSYIVRIAILRTFSKLVFGRGFSLKVKIYDLLARVFGESAWPYHPGRLSGRTPSETLGLKPGELVTIKSHSEILETLNTKGLNRGLGFAPEMSRYCGGTYRVRDQVNQILDEKTGEMVQMKSECIILENVWCRSECSAHRLFCPRGIYPYWREIWLRRTEEPAPTP